MPNIETPFTLAEMATPRGFEPPSYGVQFSEGDASLTGGEHAPDSNTVNCSPTPERTSVLGGDSSPDPTCELCLGLGVIASVCACPDCEARNG